MGRPVLSIGMIVKNEIRSLERCLQALQPLRDAVPCQLVIADTGSTDGTREVAQRYADLVFDFPWVNDFSAARNAVMDRCTGKWYLTVDADEYLTEEIGELVSFLTGKHAKKLMMAYVIQRNYNDREMDGKYTDFPAPRLLRMDSGLRYHGSIHESWMLPDDAAVTILSRTIFDHDGYTYKNAQELQKKSERNMKLLRAELEKDPNNLRRLNQCVESSSAFPQERMYYIQRAMELLMTQPELRQHYQAPSLCRTCLRIALFGRLPQAQEWLDWMETYLSESIYFQVDVTFSAAIYFEAKKQYETALAWAERYLKAQADAEKRREEVLEETSASSLSFSEMNDRQRMLCLKSECLARLGREEEALGILLSVEAEHADLPTAATYLQAMDLLRDSHEAQVRVGQVLGPILAVQPEEDNKKEKRRKKQQDMWLLLVAERFQKEKTKTDPDEEDPLPNRWHLFRETPWELGWSARLMDADREEGQALLAGMKEWRYVPILAIRRAVELGLTLPDSFFLRSAQDNRDTAAGLADGENPEFNATLLEWMEHCDFTESMSRFQFQFELLMAALRAENWKDGERAARLCTRFLDVAADYMPNYYNAVLLSSEEDWNALPGMHQFALLLLRGQKALEQGDELGWVRALRQALKAAPVMKEMVDFLRQNPPRTTAQTQLQALADKVRTILAQYEPGDPAVTALKQSPAYQKVAHLIEDGSEGRKNP